MARMFPKYRTIELYRCLRRWNVDVMTAGFAERYFVDVGTIAIRSTLFAPSVEFGLNRVVSDQARTGCAL